jgi:hypothetical protein
MSTNFSGKIVVKKDYNNTTQFLNLKHIDYELSDKKTETWPNYFGV